MSFDLKEKGNVKIKIDNYVERMINELQTKISNIYTALATAGNNIF